MTEKPCVTEGKIMDWSRPKTVPDVQFAFPAYIIGTLITEWDDLPDEFRNRTSGYEELAGHACFNNVGFRSDSLLEGIDIELANRQLNAIARSFQPKHQHKEAAIAYLLSLWLVQPTEDN
jgi:hypothetical protein